MYFHHRNQVKFAKSLEADANSLMVQRYKDSSDLNDKKLLLNGYIGQGNYDQALVVARQIADKTKSYQDYLAIISLCGLNNVTGRQDCLKQTVVELKPLVNQIPFNSAYGAAVILERNNLKKESIAFYQRAYDTYLPDPNAENMMTKEQLKAHIDELSK